MVHLVLDLECVN